MREISVEELKRRKLKAMISCLALFGLAIYGILFSPTEHGILIGVISATIGLLQWSK